MPETRMGSKEFARWRDRLMHAQRVWVERGWLGCQAPSAMRMLLEMYRGNHWGLVEPLLGLPEDQLVTVNKIFSGANTLLAQIAARDPEVQVFPRSDRAVESAPKVARLINYDIEELKMGRQWNLALRDHLFAPVGIVRHGFTPAEAYTDRRGRLMEAYRPARPDKPWMKEMKIWDCLLDPLAHSWHNDGEMKWVAFRGLMTEEAIKNDPGMIWKDGLSPNVSTLYKETRGEALLDDQNPDWEDLIEVWSVYEIWERTWHQMTLDDGISGPVREKDDWPLAWEHLPLDILSVNEQVDSCIPIPILEQAIPIQLELDRLRTIMSLVARNTRRLIGITEGGMEEDEIDKLEDSPPVEILKLKGPAKDVLAEIRAGGFPQELVPYNELIERDFRELIGQSLMEHGERINVETAEEAARVGIGGDVHTLRNQAAYEEFITDCVRNYMHGRRETMTEDELIPVGGRGADPFIRVSPDDIARDLDYKIVAGSTRPDSHQQKAAEALADIHVLGTQLGVRNLNARKIYEEYIIARGKDPSEYLLPEQPGQQPQPAETEFAPNIDAGAVREIARIRRGGIQ